MRQESIRFLNELKSELNTQDSVYQAQPRFWVIMDYKWVVAPEGCGERTAIFCFELNEDHSIDINDIGEELAGHIEDNELEDETNYFNGELNLDSLKQEKDIDKLESILEELGLGYQINEEVFEGFVAPNTFFLTIKEAKEHLAANHYHYNPNAHVYAMTAWRSPEVEKLLTILMTENFEKGADE